MMGFSGGKEATRNRTRSVWCRHHCSTRGHSSTDALLRRTRGRVENDGGQRKKNNNNNNKIKRVNDGGDDGGGCVPCGEYHHYNIYSYYYVCRAKPHRTRSLVLYYNRRAFLMRHARNAHPEND